MWIKLRGKRLILILGLFLCLTTLVFYGGTLYGKQLHSTVTSERKTNGLENDRENVEQIAYEVARISKKQTSNDYLDKDTKVILLYSTFFFQRHWSWMVGKQTLEHFGSCDRYKDCLVTYDMSWINDAHAVLFHGRDLEADYKRQYQPEQLRRVQDKISKKDQKWIYLSHENPKNDPLMYGKYNGIFHWLATFDRNSNIFIPYTNYIAKKNPHKVTRNYAKEKTGLVAWAVSNCGLLREDYALELQKYITLTVYGLCSKRFKNQRSCAHFNDACSKELSTYKFYLAFENDFCHDYVTEKYWERITQNVVPVVMGANYDKGVAIPGSYIDASEFESIQKLAEYLLYLDKNDDEYNKYFAYKGKFELGNGSIYCPICAALHEQKPGESSTAIDLGKLFNYEKNCGIYKPKTEKLRKQIEESRKNRPA
ncbi:glycoprotein 3-alpha-L-fucosyltransferase A-like [Rhopilema esculentum]|uniref:glycoprotein 3-alpha-L-fucosyltransferase A-like n=1 Tax=Rhopilema esculentum TaxID=499914 RepID=UPI0031D6AA0F|eukprot:gene2039-17604_t